VLGGEQENRAENERNQDEYIGVAVIMDKIKGESTWMIWACYEERIIGSSKLWN